MLVLDCFNQNLHSSPGGITLFTFRAVWSRGYKTFFMLNSAVHETLNAHTHKISRNTAFFQDQPRMLFFLLIHVNMPTIVGILTFMSSKNFAQPS